MERALLVGCLLLVPIVELLNSAIEANVDRVGLERHELSGRAKDIASAAVFLSIAFAARLGPDPDPPLAVMPGLLARLKPRPPAENGTGGDRPRACLARGPCGRRESGSAVDGDPPGGIRPARPPGPRPLPR